MEWKLLEVLPAEERQALLLKARRRQFGKGEPIIHEGDRSDALHLISRGHVAVRLSTPAGDRCILRVIGPGGWFGDLAMLSPGERNATIVALDPVTSLAIDRDEVEVARTRVPEFGRVFVEALVAEIRRLSVALLEAHFLPADQRVFRRLAELADIYGDGQASVTLPLTQEEIAEVAGTTRPTVNKVLQRGVDEGVIALRRGHVTVVDREQLARRGR
jgi:CRP-like cAMP-binding protein